MSRYSYVLVRAGMYCIVLDILYDAQASTIQTADCVRLDIKLLKPSRLEFHIALESWPKLRVDRS
jgi:hypothetical protein